MTQDKGDVALAVEGPRLGKGVPRLVLQRVGSANAPLETVAKRLLAQVLKRPGWTKTAQIRKTVGGGAFPCIRVGLRFLKEGEKGRARFSVVLLGDSYWVLDFSAHASHFPGGTFDRIERSLSVRWKKHSIGALKVRVPRGWQATRADGKLRIAGPSLGARKAPTVILASGQTLRAPPNLKPPNAKHPEKIEFLGGSRVPIESRFKDLLLRLVSAHGHSAAMIIPEAVAADVAPTIRAILKSVRRDPPDKKN